jgi:hypothetical protein
MLNVLRTIPEQAYQPYKFDPAPIILDIVETVFGARLGRLSFTDLQEQMTVPPDIENKLMDMGHFVKVHPMDDIEEHLKSVNISIQQDGDPYGLKVVHAQAHKQQFMAKQQAMLIQQAQQQAGGRTAPRPGAQPGKPHTAQQPPGSMPIQRANGANAPM